MTKHNDEPTTSSIEPDSIQTDSNRQSSPKPLKTCKTNKFFQWGIFCLTFLLTTSLLFIGVSFSKNISSGEVSNVSLTLTAANFDVEVNEYDPYEPGEKYNENDKQIVAYSFTIINNSNLDVNGTVVFNDMKICFYNGSVGSPDPLYGITLILFGVNDESDESGESDGGVSLFVFTRSGDNNELGNKGNELNKDYDIFVPDTVDSDTGIGDPYTYTFSLSKTDDGESSSKTYVLVLDCGSCGDNGGDTAMVTLSGTIDITVNQTNQVVEEE